jgi:hypothetical protein
MPGQMRGPVRAFPARVMRTLGIFYENPEGGTFDLTPWP